MNRYLIDLHCSECGYLATALFRTKWDGNKAKCPACRGIAHRVWNNKRMKRCDEINARQRQRKANEQAIQVARVDTDKV